MNKSDWIIEVSDDALSSKYVYVYPQATIDEMETRIWQRINEMDEYSVVDKKDLTIDGFQIFAEVKTSEGNVEVSARPWQMYGVY